MEPITSEKSWVLGSLAGFTSNDATLYSAEFTVERFATFNPSVDRVKFSLSVRTGPFHSWSQISNLPTFKPIEYSDCCLEFSRIQFQRTQIEDSDLLFQIVQALGRIPGLAHVKFSYADDSYYPSHSQTSKLDEFERLVPVFFESICSSSRSMKQIVLQINSRRQLLSTSFPIISRSCALERFEYTCPRFSLNGIMEDDKQFATFLRDVKSLKSVYFCFTLCSWQVSSALEVMMEHLTKSTIESVEYENGDHNVLQKLDLVLQFDYNGHVIFDPVEAAKIMRLMLNVGTRVGELSLCIRLSDRFSDDLLFTMRMELGAFVELDVPACKDTGGKVVEQALWLNRGPSVLSLGPLQPAVLRKILSALIPDQNGQQANTCVSTLKLVNISDDQLSSTLELQHERLAEVADVMELNSTIKHLEVSTTYSTRNIHCLQCNSTYPVAVVTRLLNTSRSRGNLQSLKFYGEEVYNRAAASNQNAEADAKRQQDDKQEVVKVQEVEKMKVQCRKYLKLDQEMIVVVTMK